MAHAGNITYNVAVNLPLSSGGSITGTITTNGTIGTLNTSDITAWHLDLVAYEAFELDQGNGNVSVSGADLTATPTTLRFNFGGSDHGYLLFTKANYFAGFGLNLTEIYGYGGTAPGAFAVNGPWNRDATAHFSGTQDIAGSGTPEPATLGLMAAALVGFGLFRAKSRRP